MCTKSEHTMFKELCDTTSVKTQMKQFNKSTKANWQSKQNFTKDAGMCGLRSCTNLVQIEQDKFPEKGQQNVCQMKRTRLNYFYDKRKEVTQFLVGKNMFYGYILQISELWQVLGAQTSCLVIYYVPLLRLQGQEIYGDTEFYSYVWLAQSTVESL